MIVLGGTRSQVKRTTFVGPLKCTAHPICDDKYMNSNDGTTKTLVLYVGPWWYNFIPILFFIFYLI
jgi:hypothetical protein